MYYVSHTFLVCSLKKDALRRFDGRESQVVTPTANKEIVEGLVTNAVVNKLILPTLSKDSKDITDIAGLEKDNDHNEEGKLSIIHI